uniref:Uncharacterized protein n=1 Tax=Anguilla anguilla TaxID=7936 RepID=A0A0E9UQ69_ANGAN
MSSIQELHLSAKEL